MSKEFQSNGVNNTGANSETNVDEFSSQNAETLSQNAFDNLLKKIREQADTERNKGNYLEELTKYFLDNDSTWSRQFKAVYLWKNWPGNNGNPDCGIDLVAVPIEAETKDGTDMAVAIQCKFYAPEHRIDKGDLDSFMSESGKRPFVGRIVVETTGRDWTANAEASIYNQQIEVRRIGLSDMRSSNIDWSAYSIEAETHDPKLLERKELRPHQSAAITDVFKGFTESDRGVLVMACGTGKTFTSLKIAERVATENGGRARILFYVPSLALMSQTLKEWSEQCSLDFQAWSVCSDTKVNRAKVTNADITDTAVVDLQLPPTTSGDKLAESLDEAAYVDGLQVVFATYQSIEVIHQAQECAGKSWADFDLIICDEAHRTTGVTLSGESESHFVKIHDNAFIRADKRLYMTATPKIYKTETKDKAQEADAVLCSMDDVTLYGPVFHRLGFGEAVEQNLLSDYKVLVLAVSEDQIQENVQKMIARGYGEIEIDQAAKLAGCWNALAKREGGMLVTDYGDDTQPMRRAVAFARDIKSSKSIASVFPALVRETLQDLDNDDDTDNLEIQCQHVDGGMNAVERGTHLDWLKDDPKTEHPVCRILTNARCLSEGVDVPTLDAVLFLNPRKSKVDVIQAVGRVMRRAAGKKYGYIILPIAIPMGITPDQALNDNERYKVVWDVLQAIRSHDDRFDARINAIELNNETPENILVQIVDLSPKKNGEGAGGDDAVDNGFETDDEPTTETNKGGEQLSFRVEFETEWKDAIYARIVKKCGSRLYWDDWSKEIAEVAGRYIGLIEHALEERQHKDDFEEFVAALQKVLNPAIDRQQAVEMLAQHIITKPLFDAMFPDQKFTEENPVSKAMQKIADRLAQNQVFEIGRKPLEKFYAAMTSRIREVDNVAGKQRIMLTLYDKFFSKAFPSMADRLGIVFTPVEVVDYILHSAEDALNKHFHKSLNDRGTYVIEPFLGTGTFVARLLQSGIIRPENLEYKFKNEIFANEIVLLSYYIASINIESVYREIRKEQGYPDEYTEFTGIALTDTFQMHESDGTLTAGSGFEENIDRVKRQKEAPLKVVIMNPMMPELIQDKSVFSWTLLS